MLAFQLILVNVTPKAKVATCRHLVITIYRVHTNSATESTGCSSNAKEPTQELIVTSDENPDGLSITGIVIINMLSSYMQF